LLAIEAGDEQAIRDRFAADPWMIKGLLELSSIEHWSIWLDGMRRQ
jgi:hypothetical protein